MLKTLYISCLTVVVLLLAGCTGNGGTKGYGKASKTREWHVSQAGDSLYTEERAMEIYAKEPQRALRMIDSAEVVGNMSEFRAELLRARVYAYPGDAMNLDTARRFHDRGAASSGHHPSGGAVHCQILLSAKHKSPF